MEGDPKYNFMFLDIDVPICRDFVRLQEQKNGCEMNYDERIDFLSAEFSFYRFRAKQIVDTIYGEPFTGEKQCA